jgi:hypothetical protein
MLDIRIREGETPEERLAAVAHKVLRDHCGQCQRFDTPDYRDFHDGMQPFVQLEIVRARLDEAKRTPGNFFRVNGLLAELEDIERRCQISP